MFKKYFIAVCILVSCTAFSQGIDSVKLNKLFFRAHDLEVSSPDSAIALYEKLIDMTKANPDQKKIGQAYHRLAELMNTHKNDLNKYFELSYKSVKIFENIKDSTSAIEIYQNLGVNFVRQSRFSEGLAYYKIVRNYSERHHLGYLVIGSTMAIAECYSSTNRSDTAIVILKNLADNFPKDGEPNDFGMLMNNLGNTYYNLAEQTNSKHNFLNAIEYAVKARDVLSKLPQEKRNLAYTFGLLGACYMAVGNYTESEKSYESAVALYNIERQAVDLELMYYELTQLNIRQGKSDKALVYLTRYDSLAKNLFSEENSNSISEMRTQFETDKKENENKLLQKENSQQKIITYFIIGGLVLALLLAFFIFNGLKKQRVANKIISKQKEEVHLQKTIIEEHQKETIDSINYAKRIQYALLANDTLLNRNLPGHFVVFNPKDIVSGDFYWATEFNNKFYLAVCDSTGHGVPGAFMSLLNMGFLSEAIKEKNISQPNEILDYVRKRLIESIGNDGQQDGMDAILICCDKLGSVNTNESLTYTYAAANSSPVLIRHNEIIELPKDRMPVGKGERAENFKLHTIHLEKGDALYLYTDGYADQFGGDKGKKFKYKQLNELLLSISNEDIRKQKDLVQADFLNWKGNLEQVDDVCVVGIKF